jgi:hypothetical protein
VIGPTRVLVATAESGDGETGAQKTRVLAGFEFTRLKDVRALNEP